ncbi:MAG TPA: hypothetical protein PLY76_12425 [Flavobacteriales bacterium]|jgi:hypothetical protein|nr:hypothetical protein [Flavobacteriales bacterium]
MNKNIPYIFVATILLAATGCKKDSTAPPSNPSTSETAVDATVRMSFSFLDGTGQFQLGNTELHDSLGHSVKLDRVRFFISGAHAIDDAGNALAHYEGVYLLVDAALPENDYLLGQIHASHIHEFHFDIGVEDPANGALPANSPPPLNDTSMFFMDNPMMGHKFLVVSGMADTGSGSFDTPVNYMCGMSMLLTEAHAHVHHDLSEGEVYTAAIVVNLHGLFNGIDLAADNMPMMDAPASMRMMQNLSAGIDGD